MRDNETIPLWSDDVSGVNVPSILPPDLPSPLVKATILRAKLEDIQRQLADLDTKARDVLQVRGQRVSNLPMTRARDLLFVERRNIIKAIDGAYPFFRTYASQRVGNTKCTRKFFLGSPKDVGLIVGPMGSSIQELEAEFHVRIRIRGKGSTPDARSSVAISQQKEIDEPLHALIECDTESGIDRCIQRLQKITAPVPDAENQRKKAQLQKLAQIRGIVSASAAFDQTSDKPPWFDSSLDVGSSPEVSTAMRELKDEITSVVDELDEEDKRSIGIYAPLIIDLNRLDISFLVQ